MHLFFFHKREQSAFLLGPQKSFIPISPKALKNASVCWLCRLFLSSWWPKRLPALRRRGSLQPTVLRQIEQAQPSGEREEREETYREKEQLAQQLSRALCCCLPLPLCYTEHTDACLLPSSHSHMSTAVAVVLSLSHTHTHRFSHLMIYTYYGGVSLG